MTCTTRRHLISSLSRCQSFVRRRHAHFSTLSKRLLACVCILQVFSSAVKMLGPRNAANSVKAAMLPAADMLPAALGADRRAADGATLARQSNHAGKEALDGVENARQEGQEATTTAQQAEVPQHGLLPEHTLGLKDKVRAAGCRFAPLPLSLPLPPSPTPSHPPSSFFPPFALSRFSIPFRFRPFVSRILLPLHFPPCLSSSLLPQLPFSLSSWNADTTFIHQHRVLVQE